VELSLKSIQAMSVPSLSKYKNEKEFLSPPRRFQGWLTRGVVLLPLFCVFPSMAEEFVDFFLDEDEAAFSSSLFPRKDGRWLVPSLKALCLTAIADFLEILPKKGVELIGGREKPIPQDVQHAVFAALDGASSPLDPSTSSRSPFLIERTRQDWHYIIIYQFPSFL